jgi:hypothetical protein
MDGGEAEDGEGLGDILLELGGELWGGLLVAGDDIAKPPLGLG